ncbi:MAG: hypothetical protein H6667_12005 [Ardenticatenaceae bacterium]|nr:hypothetical protein [Ardenticatenaceae bacterium]
MLRWRDRFIFPFRDHIIQICLTSSISSSTNGKAGAFLCRRRLPVDAGHAIGRVVMNSAVLVARLVPPTGCHKEEALPVSVTHGPSILLLILSL